MDEEWDGEGSEGGIGNDRREKPSMKGVAVMSRGNLPSLH